MRITRWAVFGVLLVAMPLNTWAQDDAKTPDKPAATKAAVDESAFEKIQAEFLELRKTSQLELAPLIKEIQTSKDSESQQAAYEKYQAAQQANAKKIQVLGAQVKELIEVAPDSDDSFKMTAWLLQNVRQDEELDNFAKSVLIEHHLQNEGMAALIPTLASSPSIETLELLKKLTEVETSDEVKATASLTRIELLSRYHDQAKMILEQSGNSLPEGTAGFFKASAEYDLETTEKDYKDLAENFGEVVFRKSTVGKYVASKLKAIENQKNLQVGKIAPEIEGLDLDGVSFKLSDYRGKVVMLDFWGDW